MSTHVLLNGQKSSVTSHNDSKNKTSSCYPAATAKYEDVAQSSNLFWATLKAFHQSFGNKFKIPTVGGKELDLHCLFVEVTSHGGFEKVIRDHRWKEVIVVFNFPITITGASFVLRKYYLLLLCDFEQVYYFCKQAQAYAVNGSLDNGSASQEEGSTTNQLGGQGSRNLQLGCSVTGVTDGKFDDGYLVTVLYHIPHMHRASQSSNDSVAPKHWCQKRSRLFVQDPIQPNSNRSGYNFFFAEYYA